MSNLNAYQNKNTVAYYAKSEGLQLPEITIYEKIKGNLKGASVLDIGVGGGRTTPFFAKDTHTYLGIDFSEEFITICNNKYNKQFPQAQFKVVDARSLKQMTLSSFDVILFSFNGIDNVNYEERVDILKTIYNLLKPNGTFIFSSHNTNYLPVLTRYKVYRNPIATIKTAFKHYKMLKKNKTALENIKNYSFIFDDTYDFGLMTCYIDPQFQLEQLTQFGFKNSEAYSLDTGKLLTNENISADKSAWVYFSARK